MRIIAGEHRSRTLHTPKDDSKTRPIPDRVKVSLFSLLRGHTDGSTVFDGFAGTGAIGLECLSRGASRVVFVEKDREIASLLRSNIELLKAGNRSELVIGDALGPGALARCPRPVRLVFLDPPYPLVREPLGFRRVMDQLGRLIDLLTDDGFAVLRTPWPLRHASGVPVTPDGGPLHPHDPDRGAHGARLRRKKIKAKNKRRHDWSDDAEHDDRIGSDREHDGEQHEELPMTAGSVDAAKPSLVDADLSLPNAAGPETHVYHNMGVHLYARRCG